MQCSRNWHSHEAESQVGSREHVELTAPGNIRIV